MVPEIARQVGFSFSKQSVIDQRIVDLGISLFELVQSSSDRRWLCACPHHPSEAFMIDVSMARTSVESAQSHDWDATKMIAAARKMPLGPRRSDTLGGAGRLRIAAEMKRWLSTK